MYLTKSRFKLALSCPAKLYYQARPDEYANKQIDDPFLQALAKGGFQVGALAKCYYPDGIEITTRDKKEALNQTTKLLKRKNVTIFEAALAYKNLFIRVDILEKKGDVINLIEVKSKSCDPQTFDEQLWNSTELANGKFKLKTTWKEYVYDIAFQGFVAKHALQDLGVHINHLLMCPDKTKKATVTGLNQKFLLKKENNQTIVIHQGDTTPLALGEKILTTLDCNEVVRIIHEDREQSERLYGLGFEGAIWKFSSACASGEKISAPVGAKCKKCEFRVNSENLKPQKDSPTLKSGFNECWRLAHGMSEAELASAFCFDIWNFKKADAAISTGNHLMREIPLSTFNPDPKEDGSLSQQGRQHLQVQKEMEEDEAPFLDLAGLASKFESYEYPFHLIDFETCMSAIPFAENRRPYEQVAFQFSHHVMKEGGEIIHASEFIEATPGVFPNFLFVRALKKALMGDATTLSGTIFRYSYHENTVLVHIHEQLAASHEPDKAELMEFIETITTKKDHWQGERAMVDLCALVMGHYYSPKTGGSNSLKYVLPAILRESSYIQQKYSAGIYHSKNFSAHTWITFDESGDIINPYDTLPPVMQEFADADLEFLYEENDLKNGGAALTAYAALQFTQMTPTERTHLTESLLRYCELDTFAMALIIEHWLQLIADSKEEAA